MEENKRKKIKVLTMGIVLAIAFLAVGTYAYWTLSKRQEHDNLVFGKCLDIDLIDASEVTNINLENSWPMPAEKAMDELEGYSFTIINNCEVEQDYVIALEDTTADPHEFSYSSISVAVDNTVVGPLSTTDNINPPGNSENLAKIIGYGTVPAKEAETLGEKTHTVRIWINETSDNSEIGYVFSSKIFVVAGQYNNGESIENEGVIKKGSIAAMMMEKANTETVIDFSVRSGISGTSGVYMTTNTDSGEPVYYYRGQVDNNLKFAGFCWKIIRTTETGGTKIIYNGTPNASGGCTNSGGTIGNSAYNSTNNDNTYVGYMVGSSGASTYATTHSNVSDSTIKTTVDNWYEENIQNKGLTVYLEDTVYCNDRNLVDGTTNNNLGTSYGILGYGINPTGYGTAARSSYYTLSANPSLVCKNTTGFVPEDNDAFTVSSIIGNGKLKYPVGLITTDEVVYAGMNTKGDKSTTEAYQYQDNNYLSSDGYWTMSPFSMSTYGAASVSYVSSSRINSNSSMVNSPISTRPVVSLRPGTQIVSGFGTGEDPYVVE